MQSLYLIYLAGPSSRAVRVTAPPCLFFLPICRGTGRVVTMLSRALSVATYGPFNRGPYRGKYSSEADADRCSQPPIRPPRPATCPRITDTFAARSLSSRLGENASELESGISKKKFEGAYPGGTLVLFNLDSNWMSVRRVRRNCR